MALDIPVGFAHAAWEFRFPGDPDPWYTTCGIAYDVGQTSPEIVADSLFTTWASTILPGQSNNMTLQGVTLRVGTGAEPVMAYSTFAPLTGGTGNSMLPQNCAMLVDKLSNLGGRKGRGRFYIPAALPEGQVDNVGVIAAPIVTSFQTAFNDFRFTLAGDAPTVESPTLTPVILHQQEGLTQLAPTEITSLRVQSIISTQRRRLR